MMAAIVFMSIAVALAPKAAHAGDPLTMGD